MKILFAHFGVFEKGGWGRTFPLAEGLAKLGNDVTIITTNPRYSITFKRENINNVKIIIFPDIIPSKITSKGFGFISLFLKILYVIFNKFDIVHSDEGHRPQSGIPCRLNKKLHKAKYIAEWWDWFGKGGQYDSKSKYFKVLLGSYELKYEIKDKLYADGIIVLSEILKQRALSLKPGIKIIKIHGGADIFKIPFIYNNSSLKEKYGIDKKIVTFGYIDALGQDIKELQPLIDSIIELNLQSRVKLLLFGGGGLLANEFPDQIKDCIRNFGWINYAVDYEKLQCVDVFVLFKEDNLINRSGWPNCVGDYFACGRPILLNPIGEVVEFADKYPDGFFISTLSKESISKNLNFIMENQSILLKKGRINRIIAENEISWYNKSLLLNDFYREIISE